MFSPVFAILIVAGGDAQPAQATSAEAKPDRKICQVYEEIGSRLGSRRVCKTARQWEEERRDQRADVQRAQQNVGQGLAKQ